MIFLSLHPLFFVCCCCCFSTSMTCGARMLKSSSVSSPSPDEGYGVNSDLVVILAALVCAVICVLGLVAVARCAWIRRFTGGGSPSSPPPPAAPANKGVKKKVLNSIPKVAYSVELQVGDDCAICLSEFSPGEEIRVLPQCGHGFHVICIDKWLASHSSCPSCRHNLAHPHPPPPLTRCHKCGGGLPPCSSTASLPPPPPPPPMLTSTFLP